MGSEWHVRTTTAHACEAARDNCWPNFQDGISYPTFSTKVRSGQLLSTKTLRGWPFTVDEEKQNTVAKLVHLNLYILYIFLTSCKVVWLVYYYYYYYIFTITITMNIVLFYVRAQMFLLVNCSFAFQYLLCFVHGQGKQTKELSPIYTAQTNPGSTLGKN